MFNPVRWLWGTAVAAIIYAVVFVFDLTETEFNLPPILHGFIRAALAIMFAVSGVAVVVERVERRINRRFDELAALTNATIEASLRRDPDREDTGAIVRRINHRLSSVVD